jgi:hypothetical protein
MSCRRPQWFREEDEPLGRFLESVLILIQRTGVPEKK